MRNDEWRRLRCAVFCLSEKRRLDRGMKIKAELERLASLQSYVRVRQHGGVRFGGIEYGKLSVWVCALLVCACQLANPRSQANVRLFVWAWEAYKPCNFDCLGVSMMLMWTAVTTCIIIERSLHIMHVQPMGCQNIKHMGCA